MNNNQQYMHNRNSNDQSLSLKKEINSKNLNSEIKSQLKQNTNECQNILKSGTKQPHKREKNCSIPQLEKKQKLIESVYEIKPMAPPKNMYLYFDPYGRPINKCEFPFEVAPFDLVHLSPPNLAIDISAKTKPTIKRRWPQPEKIDISSLTFDDETGELVLINQKELIQEEIRIGIPGPGHTKDIGIIGHGYLREGSPLIRMDVQRYTDLRPVSLY